MFLVEHSELWRAGIRNTHSGAGFIKQRERRRWLLVNLRSGFQFQLLLSAERGDFAAVGFEVSLRGFERFLSFIKILSDVFELVLEKVERLLRLRQLSTAL